MRDAVTLSHITPHLKHLRCPDALRSLPGWLIWRYEANPRGGKDRKVPYYVGGGRRRHEHGSVADRAQLVTFEVACAAAARKGFAGVGFALMPEFGVVALDFDNCVTAGGLRPDVEALVAGTYAEYSPSGQGVRAFVKGDMGNHKAGGDPFGFEVFSSKGFVTFTGQALEVVGLLGAENTVAPVSSDVRALAAERFGRGVLLANTGADDDPLLAYEPPVGLSEAQIAEILEAIDPSPLHYDDWLQVGMAIHHETEGEGFGIWDDWSSKSSKYTSHEYGEERWRSLGRRSGRPVTARYLLKLAKAAGVRVDLDGVDLDDFKDETQPGGQGDKPAKFTVVPAGEFSAGPSPEWIVKGLLPRAELAVLYGESGAGKSFMALDLGLAIARGEQWRGLRVKQGRVVYVAAEGGGGFRNRLKAYAQQHGIDLAGVPFGVIHAAPNLLMKPDALEVARAIQAAGGAAVVIVDTLAQATPGGNENSAEDMGRALAHCKGIHRATGALVLLVHHAGKDTSKGARGWSGLRAAADVELEVQRTPGGRVLRITKQKDGDDSGAWGFDLEAVLVGLDADGDEVLSCVVIDAPVPVVQEVGKGALARKLGDNEALIASVVSEFALAQTVGIEVASVLDEAVRKAPAVGEGKRDVRRQNLKRALLALCEGDHALYKLEDGCLSIL